MMDEHMRLLYFLFMCAVLSGQSAYDLLLQSGHLIDSKNRINGPRDLAIKDGKVAAAAASIPAAQARKTVQVLRGVGSSNAPRLPDSS